TSSPCWRPRFQFKQVQALMIDGDSSLQQEVRLSVRRRGSVRPNHETSTPGSQGSFSLLVQPEHFVNRFKDAALPQVLATPVMIMEKCHPLRDQGLSRSR